MVPSNRRYLLLVCYALLSLILVIPGAMKALQTSANSPLEWVSGTFGPRRDYDRFCERFAPGDVVVMSWPGCTVDESRLDRFTDLLRRAPEFRSPEGDWYFQNVLSGREMLGQLTAPPLGLPVEEALSRLQGSLVGPDRRTTCVIVTFNAEGLARREPLVDWLVRAAHDLCGVQRNDLHLAGPVIDGLTVDRTGRDSMQKLLPPSALLMLVICWWCLRSLRATLLVFAIALFGQAATLALLHYSGETMNAVLIVLPPLVQVTAITSGIHLTNYYFKAAGEGNAAEAGREAFRLGWLPTVLSAATTAVALSSLMLSDLSPIRSFGAFGAAGVALGAGLVLILVPGVLSLWPLAAPAAAPAGHRPATDRGEQGWDRFAGWIARHHAAVALVGIAGMVAAGLGVRFLSTSVRIETLFPAQSRILADYDWLETNVAPLVPIEVLLDMTPQCALSAGQRLNLLQQSETALRALKPVGGILSPVTFLPALPAGFDVPREAIDGWLQEWFAAGRGLFAGAGFLRVTPKGEQWRLTAFVPARQTMDYGDFLHRVRRQIKPLLHDAEGRPIPGVSARFTGIMPLVHEIQRYLMSNLFTSFLSTFAVITAVTIVLQAGVLNGLVAMVSNVFPGLILFGLMGWLGMPMDIGSVMTASIALGIAVDDTLHLLTFFQRALNQGLGRQAAVRYAYGHCGAAMIQTSVTCVLGLAVFGFSEFLPAQRFAWMLGAQLTAGLAGDLVLLPALLVGPLGSGFQGAPSQAKLARAQEAVRFDGAEAIGPARPKKADEKVLAHR